VTDGVHTARIALAGDFIGSTWIAGGDGQGGVSVIDPRSGGLARSSLAFAGAIAGLATHQTSASAMTASHSHAAPTLLLGPAARG
jgi:hypothetical protein